jgi:hypothetical protein
LHWPRIVLGQQDAEAQFGRIGTFETTSDRPLIGTHLGTRHFQINGIRRALAAVLITAELLS